MFHIQRAGQRSRATFRRAAPQRGNARDRVAPLLVGAAVVVLSAAIAAAQSNGTDVADLSTAAKDAAETLSQAANDSLLVRDLLGATVTAPGGETSGTVEDLVVVPGGRIVAAIIKTGSDDAERIPVPFAAVKVTRSSSELKLELPKSVEALNSDGSLDALAEAVPGTD